MKISHEICFCTLLSYLVVMENVLRIKCYLFIHLERSFNTFGRFLLQKRKSFHEIIKFFIFLKNGGSTVAPKSQAVNSDWTKKLTKKRYDINFFFQWKLRCCSFQILHRADTRADTFLWILFLIMTSILKKIQNFQNFKFK